jgi:hypothetical protein
MTAFMMFPIMALVGIIAANIFGFVGQVKDSK